MLLRSLLSRRGGHRASPFRPHLEALEDRLVPVLQPLGPLPAPISQVFHGDFNGDRKEDIAGFTTDGRWIVSTGTPTAFTQEPTAFTAPTTWANWSIAAVWKQLFVEDFNNDQFDDVAGFGFNGKWFVGLSNGSSGFVTGAAWATWADASSWVQLFVGNFTGLDPAPIGLQFLPDVAGFDITGQWWVGTSNGTSAFTTGPAWAQWSTPASWSQLFVGNFNRLDSFQQGTTPPDNRDDVAGFGINGQWHVGLSSGAGFQFTPAWAQWSVASTWRQLFVGNFTGTDSFDVAGMDVFGRWWVGGSVTNTPAGQFRFQTGAPWAQWSIGDTWSALVVGEFQINGKLDVAGLAFDGSWWVGLADDLGTQFVTSTAPWANWGNPASWSAILVANFNRFLKPPTEDAPFVIDEIQDDVAGLAFDGTWWLGITQRGPNPTRFLTSAGPWVDWV